MARILLVDDDATILGLLRGYLEKQGHEVETALTPEEALHLFDGNIAYAVLVADLALPGITGEELLERMRRKRPALAGVIMSGYPYESRDEGVRFIQKPFLPQALVVEIEKLLS